MSRMLFHSSNYIPAFFCVCLLPVGVCIDENMMTGSYACLCHLINYTLATEENVDNVRVCAGCNHFPITLNEFYHNIHPNTFEYSHKVHFSKKFFRKNIGNFTYLHNEKNQSESSV